MEQNQEHPTNQKINGIPLITGPAQKHLNRRQVIDYAEERRDLINWALQTGKDPDRGEGYSKATFKPHSYRIDQFYRWIWNENDGYTTQITPSDADTYFENELKLSDKSNSDRNQRLKALKILFRWHADRRNGEEWKLDVTFKTETNAPRDFPRLEERENIRDAALEYGTIYGEIAPTEERPDSCPVNIPGPEVDIPNEDPAAEDIFQTDRDEPVEWTGTGQTISEEEVKTRTKTFSGHRLVKQCPNRLAV